MMIPDKNCEVKWYASYPSERILQTTLPKIMKEER